MRDDYAMTMTDALRATHYAINTAAIINDDATFDTLHDLLADAIDRDFIDASTDDPRLRDALLAIADSLDALSATDFAALLLDFDFCPAHFCDLEICADDNLPECAEMRHILDLEIAAQRAALAIFPRPS